MKNNNLVALNSSGKVTWSSETDTWSPQDQKKAKLHLRILDIDKPMYGMHLYVVKVILDYYSSDGAPQKKTIADSFGFHSHKPGS